jgi:UPF0716 protein FxsA
MPVCTTSCCIFVAFPLSIDLAPLSASAAKWARGPELRMTMVLLIVLIAVPLLEIAVMIKVGYAIGFWPAFGIVIGTFMLGAWLLARSGFAAAFRVQEALMRGEPPVAAMLDGALLAMAGVLLATPGFIADVVGLALVVPPVRAAAVRWIARRVLVANDMRTGTSSFEDAREADARREPGERGDLGNGPVIEGEFERLDERPVDESSRSRQTDDQRRGAPKR